MAGSYNQKRIEALAHKYLKGTITAEEQLEFDQWFADNGEEQAAVGVDFNEDLHRKTLLARIHAEAGIGKTRSLWPRIVAAASIILVLGAGGFLLLHKQPKQQLAQNQPKDFVPGKNQATLTLAGGKKIVITKGMNLQLASNIHVDANAIAYQASTGAVTYDTLRTKRGEASPYPLLLADGTKVWLNAASSIIFPTVFSNDRLVTITGEAYFEVKHNAGHKFRVMAGAQTIEDIGTAFNVNSYTDEPALKTTLVEGSVKINNQLILKPGEQSSLVNNKLKVSKADIDAALAWKNGAFNFEHTDIQTVMRQISRWYNVDIIYEGPIPTITITGKVYRNTNATNALTIVKLLGVNYRLQGNQIIITK